MLDNSLTRYYPWQRHTWVKHQTLAPVVLFAGQAGIGKVDLLHALAYRALCEANESKPCGQCRHCTYNIAGSHPDFFVLTPDTIGKQIKIEGVRELIRFAEKTPQLAQQQVVILGPVESLTINAANALLKTLEEPTASTCFLLFSHSISQVMATIRSRCQLDILAAPSIKQSAEWLKQQFDDEKVKKAIMLAPNAPLMLKEYIENDWVSAIDELTLTLNPESEKDPSAIAQTLMTYEPIDLINLWVKLIEQWIKYHMQVSESVTQVWAGILRWPRPKMLETFNFQDKIIEYKKQLIGGANPNKQLLLEELLIIWRQCY